MYTLRPRQDVPDPRLRELAKPSHTSIVLADPRHSCLFITTSEISIILHHSFSARTQQIISYYCDLKIFLSCTAQSFDDITADDRWIMEFHLFPSLVCFYPISASKAGRSEGVRVRDFPSRLQLHSTPSQWKDSRDLVTRTCRGYLDPSRQWTRQWIQILHISYPTQP